MSVSVAGGSGGAKAINREWMVARVSESESESESES